MRRGVPIFCYWLYQMKTVIGQLIPNEYDLIPVSAIEHVVAYRFLPKDKFGLDSGGIMMVPVNQLSVLEINVAKNG